MKYEVGGKVMREYAAVRPKRYSYILDCNDENKKAKGTIKSVIKRKLKNVEDT